VITLRFGEPGYPPLLAAIHQPPPSLDVIGDPALLVRPAVAVVGARKASREGLLVAERLAADLAARGIVVVSGLAFGIDSAAHRGALVTGRTVAVLASGVDVPSPRMNAPLYRRIARDGALVSEFPRGTPALKHHFLQRNRLISGLALGTVVVEAGARSGALITARHAREQDREVLAVPGSPLRETSAGANALLKDGAALVRGWEDVVRELGVHLDEAFRAADRSAPAAPASRPAAAGTIAPDGAVARRILATLGTRPVHVDDLQATCGLEVGPFLAHLSELEIVGAVRQLPGKYFVLPPTPLGARR
jgi:DNA processing protein